MKLPAITREKDLNKIPRNMQAELVYRISPRDENNCVDKILVYISNCLLLLMCNDMSNVPSWRYTVPRVELHLMA